MAVVLNTFINCPVQQTRSVAQLHAQSRAIQHEPLLEQLYLADRPEKLWEATVKLTFSYRDAFSRDLFGGPLVYPLGWSSAGGEAAVADMCMAEECKTLGTTGCAKCATVRAYMRLFDVMCGTAHARRADAAAMVRSLLTAKYPVSPGFPEYRSGRNASAVLPPAGGASALLVETKVYNLNSFQLRVAASDPLPPVERAGCVLFSQQNAFMHMSHTSDSMFGVWKAMCHFAWRHLISVTEPYHGNAATKHVFRRLSNVFKFHCALCPDSGGCCYYCSMCLLFASLAEAMLPPPELALAAPYIVEECTQLFRYRPAPQSSAAAAAKAAPYPRPARRELQSEYTRELLLGNAAGHSSAAAAAAPSKSPEPPRSTRAPMADAAYFATSGPIRAVALPLPSTVQAPSLHLPPPAPAPAAPPSAAAIPDRLPDAMNAAIYSGGFLALHNMLPALGASERRTAEAILQRDTEAMLMRPVKSTFRLDPAIVAMYTALLSDSTSSKNELMDNLASLTKDNAGAEREDGLAAMRFACLCVALTAFKQFPKRVALLVETGYVKESELAYCEQLRDLCSTHPGVRTLDVYSAYAWLAPHSADRGSLKLLLKLLDDFQRQKPAEYAAQWKLD